MLARSYGFLRGVSVLVAVALAVPAHAGDQVDFTKLNGVFSRIIGEVLKDFQAQPNSLFKALDIHFDGKETDLSSNDYVRVKLSASATVTRTHWSVADTTLNLMVGGSADRVKAETDITLGAQLQTDVVGLGRYIAKEVASTCDHTPVNDPYDPEHRLFDANCVLWKSLQTTPTIRSFMEGLLAFAKLDVEYDLAKVAKLESDIAQADAKNKPYLQHRLQATKGELAFLERMQSELEHALAASQGDTVFAISVNDLVLPGWGQLGEIELYIDKNEVKLNLVYRGKGLKDVDSFFEMKPTLEKTLLLLQNGDVKALQSLREAATALFAFVGAYLDPNQAH